MKTVKRIINMTVRMRDKYSPENLKKNLPAQGDYRYSDLNCQASASQYDTTLNMIDYKIK